MCHRATAEGRFRQITRADPKPLTCANTAGRLRARTDDLRIKKTRCAKKCAIWPFSGTVREGMTADPKPLTSTNARWAPSGSNRRPTDQKSDPNPLGRLAIGQFVRGWLTLADSLEQRFSLLCATNVPRVPLTDPDRAEPIGLCVLLMTVALAGCFAGGSD